MEAVIIDQRMGRLFEAGLFRKWFVDSINVNIDDLLSLRAGGIVRCNGNVNDVVRFIPTDEAGLEGCIAGWISEDEA